MPNLKQVNGSEAMSRDYDASKFPKSGFNETYNSHVGGVVMGRLYPAGYAHLMPNTKESTRNEYKLYAEQLVTPVVSDVNVAVRNFFVTYRSIDKGFEDLLTPTELNGMSASLSAPCFALKDIVSALFNSIAKPVIGQYLYIGKADADYKAKYGVDYCWYVDFANFAESSIVSWINLLRPTAAYHYMDDVYDDLTASMRAWWTNNRTVVYGTSQEHLDDFCGLMRIYFDFFCGEGSVMDYLGYPIMNHQNVEDWLVHMANYNGSAYVNAGGNFDDNRDLATIEGTVGSSIEVVDFGDYEVDARLVNEYAIRAYYAIWFEYFRHKHLEPRSSNLWEYRQFGSTPLFSGATMLQAITCLLPLRCDNWTDDPFNTADVDDICRHVYAPIVSVQQKDTQARSSRVYYSSPSMPAQQNTQFVEGPNFAYGPFGNVYNAFTLQFVDNNGAETIVNCPLPDALSSMDVNYGTNSMAANYTLDLFTLKKAQMLERYLKRNFAFGDEYRDRMRAHYDVTIDDYRINRPVWLSGSFKRVNIEQEVANNGSVPGTNMSDQMVAQGSRLAYGQADSDKVSDGIEYFATEFGIRISFLSIVPRAQYDITCPHNFMKKTADFPLPEFAQQQEDIMNSSEMYRNGLYSHSNDNKPFGHVPYAHAYRYRADDVHGQMLSSKFDYTFCRFYKGLTSDGTPKLNYKFIHCRPNIPMFLNSILLDGQFYGTIKHNILSEKLLPQPVETI